MPRTFVDGGQVLDRSITSDDLDTDSVITEKIKDGNVTCQKLAPGLCDRLLKTDAPIGRIKLTTKVLPGTDFILPNSMSYDIDKFIDRVAIYRNGQLLYNGEIAPLNENDPTEVYPGSTNTMVRFDFELRRGETIQVVIL